MCILKFPFLNTYCPFGLNKGPDTFLSFRCLLLAPHHVFVLKRHQLCRLQITALDTEPGEGIITLLGRKLNSEIFYSLKPISLQTCHFWLKHLALYSRGPDRYPSNLSSGGAKWRASAREAVSVQICCWPQKVCSVRTCVSAHPKSVWRYGSDRAFGDLAL